MSSKTTNDQFADLVASAQKGDAVPLNQFLKSLYQKGKHSLLSLTHSETDAEEYFAIAVAKFWEKFVIGKSPLPKTNISGYIYTMAKFLCLDEKRSGSKIKVVAPIEGAVENKPQLAEDPRFARDFQEEDQREQLRKEAFQRGLAKLGKNCQQLFRTILEKGLEKPRELFSVLGLKNARAVTVLRYECTKQLKVKAALELELLLTQQNA